jgi:hypothetical protein
MKLPPNIHLFEVTVDLREVSEVAGGQSKPDVTSNK